MLSSTWICTSLSYHYDLSIDIVFFSWDLCEFQIFGDIVSRFNFCGENLQEIFDIFFYLMILVMDQQDVVATGGIDTNAVLFDRPSSQILCTLTGHSKKVFSHLLLVFFLYASKVYFNIRTFNYTDNHFEIC